MENIKEKAEAVDNYTEYLNFLKQIDDILLQGF